MINDAAKTSRVAIIVGHDDGRIKALKVKDYHCDQPKIILYIIWMNKPNRCSTYQDRCKALIPAPSLVADTRVLSFGHAVVLRAKLG